SRSKERRATAASGCDRIALDACLGAAQAQEMAIQTVLGAALLAQQSPLSPAQLRAQVTSKGGTTHAAITSLDADGVKDAFVRALLAAQTRARELGDAFGA
ncbi:MAG: pyrroline-5-carboxylate reductase family protein, partial [Betaproteobacteria bacterium]